MGFANFKNTKLSLTRPFGSYGKVQRVKQFWYHRDKVQFQKFAGRTPLLLNIGCGPNARKEFVNIDYDQAAGIDIVWDITKGLAFPDNSVDGIFTEHCLEHVELTECQDLLREFHRILRPGAIARIVVPDVRIYLEIYRERLDRPDGPAFPEVTSKWHADNVGFFTDMMMVNRIFRAWGHKYAYDTETMLKLLQSAGFRNSAKMAFEMGRDSRLVADSAARADQSLYVEARK